MVEIRTFKTSLRAPASLVGGISGLVAEREVLRYLEAVAGGDCNGFSRRKPGLERAAAAVGARYRAAIEAWRHCNPREIEAALDANGRAIARLKARGPAFSGKVTFTRDDIAAASGTATPGPAGISLHDYCRLAGESLKITCAHVDSIAREVAPLLPASADELVAAASANAAASGSAISEGSLRKYPEKAIAHYLGRHGNVELTAFEQVAAMMDVYRDTMTKMDFTRGLIFDVDKGHDFDNVAPVILYTYTVPRHFATYLARAWHVEPGWVRNTLIGWRRKVDGLLPASCQVEPLPAAFGVLADRARILAGGDEAQVKVIGILDRKRVLHLLHHGVDLSPLLGAELLPALGQLRAKAIASIEWHAGAVELIRRHETCFSTDALATAAASLSRAVEATAASLPPGSAAARNCQSFIAKIEAIVPVLPEISPFLEHYLPGSRYTNTVAQMLSSLNHVKRRRVSRLFTALRGIITLAFATAEAAALAKFTSVLVPANCVARPYTSVKRTKRHLPVNLLFNKYVVIRKEHPSACKHVNGIDQEAFLNNDEATLLLQAGKPVWLGIPIYSPDQFDVVTRRLSGARKGVFWFELVPTRPVITRLERGARLESIRLEVPRGPTRKIVADLILASDDPASFTHGSNFMGTMDATFSAKPFPRDDYVGSDLNALGPHAIAIGTSTSTIDLRAGKNILAPIEEAARRISALRVEIARLQRAIATRVAIGRDTGRQQAQLAMLHGRVARLRADAERRVLMVYLYALHRTGAKHASWDAVSVSTRGTKGTLAIAITGMPKRAGLLAEFEAWARDLASTGVLPRFEDVTPVSPYTGQVCDDCMARTGELRRTRRAGTLYHEFECTSCGKVGGRHPVSARVAALLLKQIVEQSTIAAPRTNIASRSSAGFL
jgi:hypothetical protein